MTVTSWVNRPGFKIRSYKDVEIFLNEIIKSGTFVFVNDEHNMVLKIVCKRFPCDRDVLIKYGDITDIFNPDIMLYGHRRLEYIWRFRKYINAKLFSE